MERNMKSPNGEPEARIAMAKCKETKGKLYGVRFQKCLSGWNYTWAFPMEEKTAKREGYQDTDITGDIQPDTEYPGCPYCGTRYFVVCGNCKHLNCNTKIGEAFTCEWCGTTGTLVNFEGNGIAAGGDRS